MGRRLPLHSSHPCMHFPAPLPRRWIKRTCTTEALVTRHMRGAHSALHDWHALAAPNVVTLKVARSRMLHAGLQAADGARLARTLARIAASKDCQAPTIRQTGARSSRENTSMRRDPAPCTHARCASMRTRSERAPLHERARQHHAQRPPQRTRSVGEQVAAPLLVDVGRAAVGAQRPQPQRLRG